MQTARHEGLHPVHLLQKDTLFKMLSRDFPYLVEDSRVSKKPSLITDVSLV